MKRFSLLNFPIENKTVLVRVDYNVPLEKSKIIDNNKVVKSLATIRFLLQKKCKVVLATHLGRPKGKVVSKLKVDSLAKELKKLLPKVKVTKLNDCIGKEIKDKIVKAKAKEIFLLENLRFYNEEKENEMVFAHSLANLADVYVNDAFSVSHRKHASLDAITKFLPAIPGFLFEKEIINLNKALKPKRPSVWILGGAKLDKVKLIKQALKKSDKLLIGGALCFPFLKAKGIPVGLSKVDHNSTLVAKKILKTKNAKRIILPLDFVITEKFSAKAKTEVVKYNEIRTNQIGLDIGPKTIELFKHQLKKAHTIVWNGPLGYFEWVNFAVSTKEIGRFLGKLTAISICGGGETAEALRKFHLEHNITHLSTGGGSALAFLSGEKLPGLVALEKNYKKFKRKL